MSFNDFVSWLKNPDPDTTLVNWWKRKRIRDREKAERERPIKLQQKAEKVVKERKSIELEAYLLWEADGKPEDKDYYYWEKAREKITGKKISNFNVIGKPYYCLEKHILAPFDSWISKQAFFTILGRIGNIAVVVAIVTFVFGEDVRRNNEVFTAWQTITSAEGKSGSGGRIKALQFLNSRPLRFPWIIQTETWTGQTRQALFWDEEDKQCKKKQLFGRRWKREPLAGLSASKAYLVEIHLCEANLEEANLEEANLKKANLKKANLKKANLQKVNLGESNLQEANLEKANLQKARLWRVNLQKANLGESNLQEANLWEANLEEAILGKANLEEAILGEANLQKANLEEAILLKTSLGEANLEEASLWRANLEEARLWGANLQKAILKEAKNLTPNQIKSACFWDKAIYKGIWSWDRFAWNVKEPDNTNYIEELKKDKSSDPIIPPDCRIWKRE